MKPEATNQWPTVNQLPATTIEPPVPTRDEHGRFLTGNSGGGRPKGCRNKLSETFLNTIARDFVDHGAEAIERVRNDDPATYLRLIGWLIPRDVILKREQAPDVDLAELDDQEVGALIEAERRRQIIRRAIENYR